MSRVQLAKYTSTVSRIRVYEHEDSLELESNEQYEVTRRRVFLDDVLLVTYHRRRGAAYLVVTGILALIFDGLAFASLGFGGWSAMPMVVMLMVPGLPATIGFLVRAIYGLDIVTVYGRRSKLAMRFRVRKQRAREVYERICTIVAQAQQRRAEEYAAEAAAAIPESESTEPPLPPGPPPL